MMKNVTLSHTRLQILLSMCLFLEKLWLQLLIILLTMHFFPYITGLTRILLCLYPKTVLSFSVRFTRTSVPSQIQQTLRTTQTCRKSLVSAWWMITGAHFWYLIISIISAPKIVHIRLHVPLFLGEILSQKCSQSVKTRLQSFKSCLQKSTDKNIINLEVSVVGDLKQLESINMTTCHQSSSCTVTEIKRQYFDMKLNAKKMFF